MRAAVTVGLFITGCASGASRQQPAGVDAAPVPDAPPVIVVDAADVDAAPHPIDAFVPQDACVPQVTELLANPAFDLDPQGVGWTQVPALDAIGGPFYPVTNPPPGPTPMSAPYHVWLGGLTQDDFTATVTSITDSIYQDVVVPAGTTQLELTGFYLIGTTETSTVTDYDHVELGLIQTNGTPIEIAHAGSNLTAVGAYTAFAKTFSNPAALAGTTIRVRATSTSDFSNNTNFFYDTLSLKATHCP
ncbi:MAG: hypothetical protein NT062_04850 [Proteobacteria bacterium]|nr:hypothetical protein [Pseudomonadota bacterium]